MKRAVIFFCLITYLLFFSAQSLAAYSEYALGAGLVYYENIRLVREPESSELAQTLSGTAIFTADDANLLANIKTRVQIFNYKNEQVADRNKVQFIGKSLWKIQPKRFEWFLADTFTQTATDSFSPDSPTNEQNVNAFITGPNYFIRFHDRNNLKLEARIASNYYENRINNNRLRGAVRWIYDINNSLKVGVNYDLETVDYAEFPRVLNNDRNDIFINFLYRKGLNVIKAEAGTTKINYDQIGDLNKPRYVFSIQNQRSRTLNMTLSYSSYLTDTAGEVVVDTGERDDLDGPLITTSNDTFVRETLRLVLNKSTLYGSYKITAFNTNYEYSVREDLDREIQSLGFYNAWYIRGDSKLTFRVNYFNTLYSQTTADREDKDYISSLLYNFNAGRNLNIVFGLKSKKRESSDFLLSYDDFNILIALEYISQ